MTDSYNVQKNVKDGLKKIRHKQGRPQKGYSQDPWPGPTHHQERSEDRIKEGPTQRADQLGGEVSEPKLKGTKARRSGSSRRWRHQAWGVISPQGWHEELSGTK